MAKFTDSQIATLRTQWDRIKTIDPCEPTYDKLISFMDSLSQDMLKQLAKENIKFVSGLARNRVK